MISSGRRHTRYNPRTKSYILRILSILFDPVKKVRQLGVDAGVLWVPATDAPGYDAALHGGNPIDKKPIILPKNDPKRTLKEGQ